MLNCLFTCRQLHIFVFLAVISLFLFLFLHGIAHSTAHQNQTEKSTGFILRSGISWSFSVVIFIVNVQHTQYIMRLSMHQDKEQVSR